MADISITGASVLSGLNAAKAHGSAGATITAGQPVYKDATTGTYKLSDSNGSGTRQVDGISLNGAAAGQPLELQTGGDITIGGTLVAGTTYCLSATAGAICPQADVTTGMDVVILGVAKSTTVLSLRIAAPGVTL